MTSSPFRGAHSVEQIRWKLLRARAQCSARFHFNRCPPHNRVFGLYEARRAVTASAARTTGPRGSLCHTPSPVALAPPPLPTPDEPARALQDQHPVNNVLVNTRALHQGTPLLCQFPLAVLT